MGKLFYFIVYKGNVGCVYCDVASHAAHGNSHFCTLQSRGVVDSVADHTDHFVFLLITINVFQLVFRETVGTDFLNMKLGCDGLRRIFMVSG